MRTEIPQNSPTCERNLGWVSEAFNTRLKMGNVPQDALVQQLAQRQEIGVPAPVLIDPQQDSRFAGQPYRLGRLIAVHCKRLIAHNRDSQCDGLAGQLGESGRASCRGKGEGCKLYV